MNNVKEVKKLDLEWVILLTQAKDMGLEKHEVREFLKQSSHFHKAQ